MIVTDDLSVGLRLGKNNNVLLCGQSEEADLISKMPLLAAKELDRGCKLPRIESGERDFIPTIIDRWHAVSEKIPTREEFNTVLEAANGLLYQPTEAGRARGGGGD